MVNSGFCVDFLEPLRRPETMTGRGEVMLKVKGDFESGVS